MKPAIRLLLAAALFSPAFAAAAGDSALRQLQSSQADVRALPEIPPTPTPEAKDPPAIDWHDAAGHVGEIVTVEGAVARAYANDKVCFLNFSADDKAALTLVIFASAFARFPAGPQFFYQDKTVRVTGEVARSSRGQLQIILNNPNQIVVTSSGASQILYWEDITAAHENQIVTVEGVVQTVSVDAKVAFLNFHPNWARYVAGTIFATVYSRFPADLKAAYEGKTVRMTGRVKLYQNRPELLLFSSSQIQVQDAQAAKTRQVSLAKEKMTFDDGDSLFYEFSAKDGLLGKDGKPFKGGLRLLGFDAPEIMHPEDGIFYDQERGQDAARLTDAALKKAEKIQFVTHGTLDKYGRMLGHLVIDGELLAVTQIKAGLAFEMITPYGDNGFPAEAARILDAWKQSPIAAAIGAGQAPPFANPGDWRKLHQIHELALPREQWDALSPERKREILAKVKDVVDQRRAGSGKS